MHIDLRTQAFGSVEVHTLIRDNQVGVTVGNERGDLRTLLGAEVPGLQTALRQQDLAFSHIQFLGTNASLDSALSGGADSRPPQPYNPRPANHTHSQEPGGGSRLPWEQERLDTPNGLNVHA